MSYAPLPRRPRKPVTSYSACHDLVRATLGRPSDHECISCGLPAQEWALMPGSPTETTMGYGPNARKRFSPNPDDYQPMDRRCHRQMDRQFRVARKAVSA